MICSLGEEIVSKDWTERDEEKKGRKEGLMDRNTARKGGRKERRKGGQKEGKKYSLIA